jgi:hypothetical protein
MKRSFVSTFVMMSAMFGLSACGGGASNGFVSSPSNGGGGTDTGGIGGTVQSTGIFISMVPKDQPVTTYLHQFNNFNAPCTIVKGAAPTDMQCLLNVRELDLYEQGLKMDLNIAPGMCDYVSDVPYSFYNRRPGHGPIAINIFIDDNAPGTDACTVTKANGVVVAGVISGHSCNWAGGTATPDGTATCDYDYSTLPTPGPNCCEGIYSFNSSLKTVGATSFTSVNTTGNSWKGNNSLCLAGPYLDSTSGWKYNSKTGAPYEQIRPAKVVGFNQYYTIKAPITLNGADNTYAANFWDWTSYAAGALSNAALPTAMKNSADALGIFASVSPHPSYDFTCYDQAMEVKHRIRVYINEWDTDTAFTNYAAALTEPARVLFSPVATGACDLTGGPCDDIWGWSQYTITYPNSDINPRQ